MPSFAPVTQHRVFFLDTTIGRNFPWFLGSIIGSPPAEKILTCLLPFLIFLLNLCLPLNTDTTALKLEKTCFSISKRTNSSPEIQTYFKVPKTALDLCNSSSSFAIQRPKQTLKEKLCTEHLSNSLPQILQYEKYPDLESFFEFLLRTLCGQAVISP